MELVNLIKSEVQAEIVRTGNVGSADKKFIRKIIFDCVSKCRSFECAEEELKKLVCVKFGFENIFITHWNALKDGKVRTFNSEEAAKAFSPLVEEVTEIIRVEDLQKRVYDAMDTPWIDFSFLGKIEEEINRRRLGFSCETVEKLRNRLERTANAGASTASTVAEVLQIIGEDPVFGA